MMHDHTYIKVTEIKLRGKDKC